MQSTFNSLAQITGLPFRKRGSRMIASCYIDGSPHRQKDKTYAILKDSGIYIKENGGDDLSLKAWLSEYGDISKLDNEYDKEQVEIKKPKKLFISEETLESTIPMYYDGNLYNFLSKIFGKEEVSKVFYKYNVGEKSCSEIVFWYVNELNQICHDAIIPYGINGKRDKDRGGWRKYQTGDGYYGQCMFGQHLLPKWQGEVCVVESEKTALIMSLVDDKRLWMATGGASHLSCIRDTWKLYPDYDNAGSFWECIGCNDRRDCIIKTKNKKRIKEFGCHNRNKNVVFWWKGLDVKVGDDVGDFVLNKYCKHGK